MVRNTNLFILAIFLLIPLSSALVVNQDVPVSVSPRLNGAPISSAVCNLTVSYNGTLLIPYHQMTFNSLTQTANYTIPKSNITRLGDYNRITTCCSGTNCATAETTFNVNKSGIDVEDSTPIFYLGLLLMSGVLSWFFLWLYRNTNGEDTYNNFGELLDINWKKHTKKVLLVFTISCMVWTIYNTWVIAYNFLELDGMSRILFMMWTIPIATAPYLMGGWLIIMMWSLFNDFMKMKEIERFGQT